jgi:hypothetical protein
MVVNEIESSNDGNDSAANEAIAAVQEDRGGATAIASTAARGRATRPKNGALWGATFIGASAARVRRASSAGNVALHDAQTLRQQAKD